MGSEVTITMKRTVLMRVLLGFPLGIAIGYIITIAISACYGTTYLPCTPSLAAELGSELSAVILQAVLCGILGAACAAASCAFQVERWSLAKATAVHFLVLSFSMLPIAYVSHWMEHTLSGVLCYFGIFVGIYVLIWFIQYLGIRARVRRINAKLQKK